MTIKRRTSKSPRQSLAFLLLQLVVVQTSLTSPTLILSPTPTSSKLGMNATCPMARLWIAWFLVSAFTRSRILAKRLLVYDELIDLGGEGGYSGLAILASNSAVLILSVCCLLRREWFWFTPEHPYDEDEYDDICALISQLESDIMTTAVGIVLPWAAEVLPSWGLLCDGSVYNDADYPELAEALGETWEEPDDKFRVPSMRGRVPAGSGVDYDLSDQGGAQSKNIALGEMPAHTHTTILRAVLAPSIGGYLPAPMVIPATTGAVSGSAGGTDKFNVEQPYQVFHMVIVSGRYTDHGA